MFQKNCPTSAGPNQPISFWKHWDQKGKGIVNNNIVLYRCTKKLKISGVDKWLILQVQEIISAGSKHGPISRSYRGLLIDKIVNSTSHYDSDFDKNKLMVMIMAQINLSFVTQTILSNLKSLLKIHIFAGPNFWPPNVSIVWLSNNDSYFPSTIYVIFLFKFQPQAPVDRTKLDYNNDVGTKISNEVLRCVPESDIITFCIWNA